MRLYEIMYEIENCVDFQTGEIDVERLSELEIARDEKIQNSALFIKNLRADAEAFKKEKLEFAKRQKQAEMKVNQLKYYLSKCLDGNKFETDKVKISFRKSESVEIDESLFDDDRFFEMERKYNLSDIKKALKKGERIDGAEIVESQNIQIK